MIGGAMAASTGANRAARLKAYRTSAAGRRSPSRS